MATHPHGTSSIDRSRVDRTEQLQQISERLAMLLESLDLETEAQLADEVIAALQATDRACELEHTATTEPSDEGMFQFDSTAIRN